MSNRKDGALRYVYLTLTMHSKHQALFHLSFFFNRLANYWATATFISVLDILLTLKLEVCYHLPIASA